MAKVPRTPTSKADGAGTRKTPSASDNRDSKASAMTGKVAKRPMRKFQAALVEGVQPKEPASSASLNKENAAQRVSDIPRQLTRRRQDMLLARQYRTLVEALPEGRQREQAEAVFSEWLEGVEPIPVTVAASLLGLSAPTVKKWMEEGVLIKFGDSRPVKLEAARVFHVADLVERLREAGKTRGMLDAIWYRLADQALLDREDLQESLGQALRGEGRIVRHSQPGEGG